MASAPKAGLEAALRLRLEAQIDVDARELRPAHRAPHFSVRWLTQNNEGRAKYRDDQPEQSLAPRISPQRVDEEVLRRRGGREVAAQLADDEDRDLGETGPLSQGVQAGRKALRIRYI